MRLRMALNSRLLCALGFQLRRDLQVWCVQGSSGASARRYGLQPAA